mgnify:CR=1 FL=1|tara:strand:+ start:18843 stop:20321 length:1479 start_codon:yes stop_codon:yes gene_type:complete
MKSILKLFGPLLDENEVDFIKNNKKLNKGFSKKKYFKSIFVETQMDYTYIRMIQEVIKKHPNNQFIGYYPNKFIFKLKELILVLPFILRLLIYRRDFKRNKKLYNSIGVLKVFKIENLSLKNRIKNLFYSFRCLFNLKNNKSLIGLKVSNIRVGDLIYDSYLRYHNRPTFGNKNYLNFIFHLTRVLNTFQLIEIINKNYSFDSVFSIYASYVHHGSIVRWFLKKNIDVFTSGTDQKLFKKQNKNFPFESLDHTNYMLSFLKLKNTKELSLKGINSLQKRFKGVPDLNYMFKSSYKKNNLQLKTEYDGVIFLHDFFDCVHLYRNMIFDDFYQWTIYLLDMISEFNLNIGIKPHPLQRTESKNICFKLMKQYPNHSWIDPDISNTNIFNSGIKFGLSVYGTVLSELAFHNIIPISCGDNPTSSFNFTFEAKSIKEYRRLILDHKNLKLPKNYMEQIGQFYYMHYINNSSDIDIKISNEILEKKYINYDSSILNL